MFVAYMLCGRDLRILPGVAGGEVAMAADMLEETTLDRAQSFQDDELSTAEECGC